MIEASQLPGIHVPGIGTVVWWWLTLILLIALVAWVVIAWLRHPRPGAQVKIAHSHYIRQLRSYQNVVRFRRTRITLALLVVFLSAGTAALVAGRPADVFSRSERLASRDIVLCLDVSGSMISYDSEILNRFADLVKNFQGERIALVIWNSTSRTVFPLTDDYDMIHQELDAHAKLLDLDLNSFSGSAQDLAPVLDFLEGTTSTRDQSASLIGDGLVNCVQQFDQGDKERSRSVIFATDNDLRGEPIFTLPQATAYAQERGVEVIGLFSATAEAKGSADLRTPFTRAIEEAGGKVFDTTSPDAAASIVDKVEQTTAHELDANPTIVVTDHPERLAPVLIGLGLVSLLVLGWWRL
ncbi:MAG: VWA domain-containing protein [Bowdeniella nasicola]|nr:VWA domain-containing protein [Bowdeniella nasicola]